MKRFSSIMMKLYADIASSNLKKQLSEEGWSAPFASLEYEAELRLKNRALGLFWQEHALPGSPALLIPSPKPRAYRTTSKRKASFKKGSFRLSLDGDVLPERRVFCAHSTLEPPEHGEIYRFLYEKLRSTSAKIVASHLNYIIIRGSYTNRAVIFNVDLMNGAIVRKLKGIAKHLQDIPGLVQAAFIFLDPSHSDYYLESKRPDVNVPFKKLFGPPKLTVCHDGCRYRYDPTSFSQVNESIVPILLHAIRDLIKPAKNEHLLDLYCGYGLFSHYFAGDYQKVVGVDAEGPAIRSAIEICRLNARHSRTKFLSDKITGNSLQRLLPLTGASEVLLLDPPRQGPHPGVIDALGERKIQKILHIFCGVDQIPTSIREWQRNGYEISQVIPLDMFPGSANLEVLILFEPR